VENSFGNFTRKGVHEKLTMESRRREIGDVRHKSTFGGVPHKLVTNPKEKFWYSPRVNQKRGLIQSFLVKCTMCNQYGHKVNDCPLKKRLTNSSMFVPWNKPCFRCNEIGHGYRVCKNNPLSVSLPNRVVDCKVPMEIEYCKQHRMIGNPGCALLHLDYKSCWCCGSVKHWGSECRDTYNYKRYKEKARINRELQFDLEKELIYEDDDSIVGYGVDFKDNRKWIQKKNIFEGYESKRIQRSDKSTPIKPELFTAHERNIMIGPGPYCPDPPRPVEFNLLNPGGMADEITELIEEEGRRWRRLNPSNSVPVSVSPASILSPVDPKPEVNVPGPTIPPILEPIIPNNVAEGLFKNPVGHSWIWYEDDTYFDRPNLTYECEMEKMDYYPYLANGDARPDIHRNADLLHEDPVYSRILFTRRPVVRVGPFTSSFLGSLVAVAKEDLKFARTVELIVSEEIASQVINSLNINFTMDNKAIYSRLSNATKNVAKVNQNRALAVRGHLICNDTITFAYNIAKYYMYSRRDLLPDRDFIK
jgi:hypothetical protein